MPTLSWGQLLPQVEKINFIRVIFMSEGKMEREIDRQIRAILAVMWMLKQSIVVKRELSQLRWFGLLVRIPPVCLPGRCFRYTYP